MGSITVVNLTDSSIQSAITNAGLIYSGINGVLPNVYYHHQAVSGTGYDVWEKWYIKGITEDFPSNELTKIGWYIGSAIITAVSVVAVVASIGAATVALAPALAAFGAGIAVATGAADVGAAVATFLGASYTALGGAAGLAAISLGGIGGIFGAGYEIGAPVADYLATLQRRTVGTVWGQDNRILSFTGKIPLEVSLGTDAQGQTTLLPQIPAGMTAETAPPPTYSGDLTFEVFDGMRKRGEIYQIKHRDGEYQDMTQFSVNLNLRGELDNNRIVSHGGITLDLSRRYRIFLWNAKENKTTGSCLMAGEDEDDHKVYLRQGPLEGELSHCSWQFIPTREHGGGWIIVDRRYVRFLYWSHSESDESDKGEILQYHSQEVGIKMVNGWAENVTKKGMVWNLSSFYPVPIGNQVGVIEQPGKDRICVTGRTDLHKQIYAREYRAIYSEPTPDVFQHWVVTVDW